MAASRPVVFTDSPDWRLRTLVYDWVPTDRGISSGEFWASAGPGWTPVLLEQGVGLGHARTTAAAAGCQYEKVMPDRLILPVA